MTLPVSHPLSEQWDRLARPQPRYLRIEPIDCARRRRHPSRARQEATARSRGHEVREHYREDATGGRQYWHAIVRGWLPLRRRPHRRPHRHHPRRTQHLLSSSRILFSPRRLHLACYAVGLAASFGISHVDLIHKQSLPLLPEDLPDTQRHSAVRSGALGLGILAKTAELAGAAQWLSAQ